MTTAGGRIARPFKVNRAAGLLGLLLCLLVAGSVASAPANAARAVEAGLHAQPRALTGTEVVASNSPCLDAIFLGARGSGQLADDHHGFGQQIDFVRRSYLDEVTGHRVGWRAINYPAQGVDTLLIGKFFKGLDEGVDDTVAFLKTRATMCPDEHYVLAGYSQGAMVMHRVLWALADAGGVGLPSLGRIDGLVLVADGDRLAGQGGTKLGTAEDASGVSFLAPALAGDTFKPQDRVLPDDLASRASSICDTKDLVCDPRNAGLKFPRSKLEFVITAARLAFAKTVHTDHYLPGAPSDGAVVRAAQRAADVTNARPAVPAMMLNSSLPAAVAGHRYAATLTASGGLAPYAYFSPALPAGMQLSALGRLSGTPASIPATFRVRTTDSVGQIVWTWITLKPPAAQTDPSDLKGKIARLPDGASWYVDERGGKHKIGDGGTYQCIASQGIPVVPASSEQLSKLSRYEDAACVRANAGDVIRTSDGDSYLINADWTRSWIPDGGTFMCLRANGHNTVAVPRYYVDDLTQSSNVSFSCYDANAVKGKVVRAGDGTSYYVDKRGGKHWIPDGGTFECIADQTGGAYPYTVPRAWLTQKEYEHAQCVRPKPGDIIRTDDGDSYLVNADWTRSWIPDGGTFSCLRANGHRMVAVPRYYVDDLSQASNVTFSCYDVNAVKGKVVRASDGSSYYVDRRGGKHWIPDGGTFDCVAAQTGGAYQYTVPAPWLTQKQYENAQCVRANPGDIIRHSDGDAYVINGDWTRSWIPTAASYVCYSAENRGFVNNVPRYYIDDLSRTGDANYPSGHCIVRRPDGAAYYVNNEGKREWIPDTPTWDCETGRGTPVINSTADKVGASSEVGWHYCLNKANLHNKMLRHTDGDVSFIHPDDTRTWIPDEFTYNCRARAGVPLVETRWREYVNAFTDAGWDYCFDPETFKGKFIRHPDGDAYYVDQRGVKHWVPNGGTYNCLVSRFGNPATVRWRDYINRIPGGDWAVCGDTLGRNVNLDQGQWLQSGNGAYRLYVQSDGNLVLYHGGTAIWASNTVGRPVHHLKLHDNGCLALIDSSGNWLWRPSPDPCNKGGTHLVVQNDGNLVLYANSTPVWASNTAGR